MAAKKQFYAVVKGRRPGIYTQWTGAGGAQEQVSGYAGAVYRGFVTRVEAVAYLSSGGARIQPPPAKTGSPVPPGSSVPAEAASSRGDAAPAARRPRAAAEYSADLDAGKVVIFTDGASTGNPGPGGYGVVILSGKQRKELSGGFRCTTNNRMELMGVITALESLEPSAGAAAVIVYSDSRYVVDALTKGWAARWRKNNWMRTASSPAENADLWARLLRVIESLPPVEFRWVRGHASSTENERCDHLAVRAAHGANLPDDTGFNRRC